MASASRQLADTSTQHLRAKRISDAQWELWRPKLLELYLEKDASRKEIVDTMAQENSFIITETQLKRRFRFWGVKKYIPHEDMTAILSVKSQQDAAGKPVRIQYKNRDIAQERLERAFKRRKGQLKGPRAIPPYIQYSVRSQPSPLTHNLSPGGRDANVVPANRTGLASNARISELAPRVYTPGSKAAFGTLPWSTGSHHPAEDCQGTLLCQAADYGETSQQSNFVLENNFDDQIVADPNTWASNFELPTFSGSSLNEQASRDVSAWRSDNSQLRDLPENFLSDFSTSPLEENMSQGMLQPLTREYSPLLSQESAYRRALDPTIFEGSNPEEIVLPLHLLKLCLPVHLTWDSMGEYVASASQLADLFKLVNSMQLSLEIEDLLCQSFEFSARSIRERQATKSGIESDIYHRTGSSEARVQHSRSHSDGWVRQMVQEMERKGTHHLMWAVSKGTIKLRLTPRKDVSLGSIPQPILCVSFIPRDDKRTAGVTISFSWAQDGGPGYSLGRFVKTVNVVPEDSEVIQCVSRNDLRSLQMLFDKHEASPLDVDPQGFSLVSYAKYNGCSEVYLLLLQGGASTQDCDRFGNPLDVVWAIWSTFTSYNSRILPASYYLPNVVMDFDQVVSMTDAALRYGCDIEDAAGYLSEVANALFEIVRWCPLKEPHLSVPGKAINYLVKIGYDIERRNSRGLTPLLHAASSYQPQVIQCLSTYIKRGADINAIDTLGRGALHRALAVPHCFDSWKTLRLTDYILFDIMSYYYVPMCVLDTESVGYAKDYEDTGLDSKPLEYKLLAERPILRGKVCLGKCQSSRLHGLGPNPNSAKMRLDWTVPSDICECGINFDEYATKITAYGDPYMPDGSEYEYIVCQDSVGAEHFIKHRIIVLKTRLRFKLLTLLRANCDPNVLDEAGASPSDYARRDGLWPQWCWALKNAAFSYEPESDRWVRAWVP